jgi:hypothetical protein
VTLLISTKHSQLSIRLTPGGHPDKPGRLSHLGLSFTSRFQGLGDIADLDEAMTQSVRLTTLTSLNISVTSETPFKYGLSVWVTLPITIKRSQLSTRPSVSPHIVTLASLHISIASEPPSASSLSVWVTLLISTKRSRFSSRPSVSPQMITPTSLHTLYLLSLGTSFHVRFSHDADNATLAQAITASICPLCSSPQVGHSLHPNETLDAYSTLINLLPHLVWLGRTLEQRYNDISRIGNAVADAVVAAIHFGRLGLALEWMEQGRLYGGKCFSFALLSTTCVSTIPMKPTNSKIFLAAWSPQARAKATTF